MAALLGQQVQPPLELHDGMIVTEQVSISISDLWDEYRRRHRLRRSVLTGPWLRWSTHGNNVRAPSNPTAASRTASSQDGWQWPTSPTTRGCCSAPPPESTTDPTASSSCYQASAITTRPLPPYHWRCTTWEADQPSAAARAAPLALRMFVESVLSVPMHERERGQPVAMSVSLREFLQWLYPTRTPTPAEYWPKLMKAIEALDSWDARIPLYDPQTRRSELRRVVSVSGIPRGPGALDESVRIIVDLPPGSGNGPQVSDRLRIWGITSGPAYRLLINLSYQWHKPGVTTVPVRKRKTRHWVQVNDPDRYQHIKDDDLIALTFPSSAVQNRRVLLQRTKAVVEHLHEAGELRIIDGKILPPERR